MAVVAGVGCGKSTFQCQGAGQCVLEGQQGSCQPSGFCSFDDDACLSGQRYGEGAPDGLSGMCVERGTETSGGGEGMTGSGTTLAEPLPSGSSPTDSLSTTTETGEGASTEGVGMGSLDESSGESGYASSEGDTSCSRVFDEFDDGVVGGGFWDSYFPHAPPLMREEDGYLVYDIWAQQPRIGVLATGVSNFEASRMTVHLAELPEALPARMSLILLSLDNEHNVMIRVQGGPLPEVLAFDNFEQLATTTLDGGVGELWMRMEGHDGTLDLQYSIDGQHFETLSQVPAKFIYEPVAMHLQGGSIDTLGADQTMLISRFEFCGIPG